MYTGVALLLFGFLSACGGALAAATLIALHDWRQGY